MPVIVRNFHMSPTINYFYNVSEGVGWRRRNDRLDVLLVQFFLNHLTLRGGGRLIQPALDQDGIFGEKTQAAIGKFQDTWNAVFVPRRPRVAQDCIVSPAQGATHAGGSRTWTILALNALVGNPPNFGLDMYTRLHTHPNCPPDLIPFFSSAPRRPTVVPRPRPAASRSRPSPSSGTPSRAMAGRVPRAAVASHSAARASQLSPPRPGRARPAPAPAPTTRRTPGFAAPPSRTRQTTPRPFNRRDPGVRWADHVLSPGRSLFTRYEYSEILEMMEGTGHLPVAERTEMLLQMLELTTGDGYPRGTTASDLREFLRQEAMLGRPARLPGHLLHF